MTKILQYTYLAFNLNSLLDGGSLLDYDETVAHIGDGTLFGWLEEKFRNKIDLSLLDVTDAATVLEHFQSLANAVDAERKFGVRKNGLCLLIAYCVECIQQARPR